MSGEKTRAPNKGPRPILIQIRRLTPKCNGCVQRDKVGVGEGQRQRKTESEAGSRLHAVSTEPDVELELMNSEIMT